MMRSRGWLCGLGVTLCMALAACESTAVSKDSKNTFLTADDLVAMTDKMAQSILKDPDVAAATAKKPMIIVMKPVVNETNEIMPRGQKELYVHRLRVLLSSQPALRERFVFVLNKADYEKLQKEEGLDAAALGTPETRVQPEYALWGVFYADTNARSTSRSDTYFCGYKLTTLQGDQAGIILWEDAYETSKFMKKGFLD